MGRPGVEGSLKSGRPFEARLAGDTLGFWDHTYTEEAV